MKEYDNFKNLSFLPLIDSQYTVGSNSTINYLRGVPVTGTSSGGALLPFNSGDLSVKATMVNRRLYSSVTFNERVKLDQYGETILNSYKIRKGTYILIQKSNLINLFGANKFNLPIQNNNAFVLKYPDGEKAFSGTEWIVQPFFKVIEFKEDYEPTIETTNNFMLMDGRKLPNYISDFDKLSYSVGSEEHKSDSFLATTTYSGSTGLPYAAENIADFKSEPLWVVSDDLTYYENRDSEYPNTAGVYFYMFWNEEDFNFSIITIPDVNGSGMDYLPAPITLKPVPTFGVEYKGGVYIKRIHDMPKYGDTIGYEDIVDLHYTPKRRPFNSNIIHSMYYTKFTDSSVSVQGESFVWSLSFGGGSNFPDFPEWQDTSSGLDPKLAFFQLIHVPDIGTTPAYGSEKVADVTLVMNDGSEVRCEIIPSKSNWCMVPLNGRKISSVVGNFVNRNSRFLIANNCMQIVYFL